VFKDPRFKVVNRSVVIVRPKAPFFQWIATLYDGEGPPDDEAVQSDPTAYLVEEIEDEEDEAAVFERRFATIFEHELAGWETDPGSWPKERGWGTFCEWFDLELHTMAVDLVPTKLTRE
jgi:hypothetical protein